jgi:uncharacterized integral membrane protein
MVRKIAAVLILLPVALAIVLFAVANRAAVTVSLDPFANDPPAVSAVLPLFLLLLLVLIAGVILGGVSAWMRQSRWRRRARRLSADLKAVRAEAKKKHKAASESTSLCFIAGPSETA